MDEKWRYENQGFVDPLTNDVNIPHITESEVRAFLHGANLNLELLSVFQHEATHNWCYQSLVGDSLAFIEADISLNEYPLVRVVLDRVKSDRNSNVYDHLMKEHGELIRNINNARYKYKHATNLLSPLLEGIALFAEFDLITDYNSIAPTSCCQRLFASPYKVTIRKKIKNEKCTNFIDYLIAARKTERSQERKINLLVSPYGFQSGGHLPGYLFVKSIYYSLREFFGDFDHDCFLFVLKAHIFDSAELASLILNQEIDYNSYAKRFSAKLNEKIQMLKDVSFWDRYFTPSFKKWIKDNEGKGDHIIIGSEPQNVLGEVSEILRDRYSYFGLNVDGTFITGKSDKDLPFLDYVFSTAFLNRRFIRVISQPCEISLIKIANIISVRAKGLFSLMIYTGDFLDEPVNEEGTGSVDVYSHFYRTDNIYVFSITDSTILVLNQATDNSFKEDEQLAGAFTSIHRRQHIRNFANTSRYLIGNYFKATLDEVDATSYKIASQLYSPSYYFFRKDVLKGLRLPTVLSHLRQNGLYDLLQDIDLVEKIALLENQNEDHSHYVESIRERVQQILNSTRSRT